MVVDIPIAIALGFDEPSPGPHGSIAPACRCPRVVDEELGPVCVQGS